ncbi:MAG: hypothetical protein JXR58_05440 [Bacteroidales bacterium]|nr:hypothetical protein [Bacteroidales bacterium]
MIEELKKLGEMQVQLAQQAYNAYAPVVDNIINSKIQDNNQIELTLDYMLEFCCDEKVLALYKKLCRYYLDINPQGTVDYIQYYRERWDEESLEKKEDEE